MSELLANQMAGRQEALKRVQELEAEVARLREVLQTVRTGCSTAEREAALRYGENWRNNVIDDALEDKHE